MTRIKLLFLLLLLPVASADTIDFEGVGDGTSLTNQYAGVVFSNAMVWTDGLSLNGSDFPPLSGSNVAVDDSGFMTLTFPTLSTAFTIHATYAVPLSLRFFDASNTLLITLASAFGNNSLSAGDLGSSPNEQFTYSYLAGISRVEIEGAPTGTSFVVDDVSYAPLPPVNAVPEPATFALSAIALLCVLLVKPRKTECGAIGSFTGFVVRAAPLALLRNPRHNARWRDWFLSRFGPRHAAVPLLRRNRA